MRYAQIDSDGLVVGVSLLAAEGSDAHLIPLSEAQGDVMGMRWDGVTFAPVPSTKLRLRVTANQPRIWESTPGVQPDGSQIALLTGQILDVNGQPDPTATMPETAILLPASQAGANPALVLVRATAGWLEIQTRQGWSSSMPFATEHSGRYDMAVLLAEYFDVVDAPVIEVLRG